MKINFNTPTRIFSPSFVKILILSLSLTSVFSNYLLSFTNTWPLAIISSAYLLLQIPVLDKYFDNLSYSKKLNHLCYLKEI